MKFNFLLDDEKLYDGLAAVAEFYPFEQSEKGTLLRAVRTEGKVCVQKDEDGFSIRYTDAPSFFYAFSYCLTGFEGKKFCFSAERKIKEFGFMRDCARNGAIDFPAFRKLTVSLALLGYTYLELYVEDLMQIESLPYLGANRPAYSAREIGRMEAFAAQFGISLVPCIQTLAHLPQMFSHDAFESIHDAETVLLVDEPETYAFLDKEIGWTAKTFRSRRINIGMDEAYEMCTGTYADRFGIPQDRTEVFLRHLEKVLGICRKYGFRASAFSDMFFRCGLKHEAGCSYENIKERNFSAEFAARVPEDLTLIFWDYNHDDEEFYDVGFSKHKQISDKISYACGTWSWKGFAPFNTIAEKNSRQAFRSSAKHGVEDFLVTFWGDNGAECSTFSVLSTLLCLSEENYFGRLSTEALNERCEGLFGNSYEEFKNLEDANATAPGTIKDGKDINPSKYHLYGDALLGVFDGYAYPELEAYFARNAAEFLRYKQKGGRFSYLFDTLYRLSRALEIKATLGLKMKKAYSEKDVATLKEIASTLIPECIERIRSFYEAFSFQWKRENKDAGAEVGDLRIGGLLFRLEETAKILWDYVNGKTERIEELEGDRLPFYGLKKGRDVVNNLYTAQIGGSEIG